MSPQLEVLADSVLFYEDRNRKQVTSIFVCTVYINNVG